MNILAWVLQALLAFYYLLYGIVLVVPPAPMRPLFAGIPFSVRMIVAMFAFVAAILLVLPAVIKSLRRMVLPAAVVLTVIAGGEALFRLMRHESLPTKVRSVFFAMALVLVLIRWRIAVRGRSASQSARRA
jgi:4-amino-4-deoxy-L-arabinose transferase-like glycosyltransferase